MNFPPIVITLLTYKRNYVLKTVYGITKNLSYSGDIYWYIADAGSPKEHIENILSDLEGQKILGWHSKELLPGQNWNLSIRNALTHTCVYLRLEDDYELIEPLDITPYVTVLKDNNDVGMVSLRYLPHGLELETVSYNGYLYFDIKKNKLYTFSGAPSLIHVRLHEACGLFDERIPSPGDNELFFDYQVRKRSGDLKILRAANISANSPFGHIGAERSYG